MDAAPATSRRLASWAVHILTLTGVVWAVLATIAALNQQPKAMWLYLGIALLVDAADGPLARKVQVGVYTPGFDGAVLDIVVDYLTWSFVPALFLYTSGLLGSSPWSVGLFILIAASSMFCYANVNMKTGENYFQGFPAAWNVVAFSFWMLGSPVWLNSVTVLVLAALTLAPVTFVHPFRVKRLRYVNVLAVATWMMSAVILVLQHPAENLLIEGLWLLSGLWLLGVGLLGMRKAL